MKAKRKNAVLILAIFSSLLLHAQEERFLLLTKIGSRFRLKIYQYESITLRLKDSELFTSGVIEAFEDSAIIFYDTPIKLVDIAEIDIRNKNHSIWSFRSSPGKLVMSGVMLTTIDLLNQREPITRRISLISGGLILSGIVMKALERKYFIPDRKNKIQIIGL